MAGSPSENRVLLRLIWAGFLLALAFLLAQKVFFPKPPETPSPETASTSITQALSEFHQRKSKPVFLRMPAQWQSELRSVLSNSEAKRAAELGKLMALVIEERSELLKRSFLFNSPGTDPDHFQHTLNSLAELLTAWSELCDASGSHQEFVDVLDKWDSESPPLASHLAGLFNALGLEVPAWPLSIHVASLENGVATAQVYFPDGRTETVPFHQQEGQWIPEGWDERWREGIQFAERRLRQISEMSQSSCLRETLAKMRTTDEQSEFDELLRSVMDELIQH